MERLERPAALHETLGQPIEQFRMRRALAERAKVVGCSNETSAKMPAPDAVDHHSAGKRMPRIDQPLHQLAPATFAGRELRRNWPADNRRNVPDRYFAQLLRIAADM